MALNSQLLNFFIEIWNRLRTKSPKIFKILQLFAASLTLAGYLPSMLQRWFNIEVPGHIITMCEDISKYAAGFFAAVLLPAKTTTVAQTEEGSAVIITDEKKLPFSAKIENKEVVETVPQPPVLSEVPEIPKDN